MCAISINWYDWDWGESEEKNLSRLLYRICGSGLTSIVVQNIETNEGEPLVQSKKFQKKSHNAEKNPSEKHLI